MKKILIFQIIKIENINFLRAVKITALFLYNLYTYLYLLYPALLLNQKNTEKKIIY